MFLYNSENSIRCLLFCHNNDVKYAVLHLFYSSEPVMRLDYQILQKSHPQTCCPDPPWSHSPFFRLNRFINCGLNGCVIACSQKRSFVYLKNFFERTRLKNVWSYFKLCFRKYWMQQITKSSCMLSWTAEKTFAVMHDWFETERKVNEQ